MIGIGTVTIALLGVSGALSLSLSEVLKIFQPDEYMTEELEPLMEEWGGRTLHEFMEHIASLDDQDPPDLLNGEMELVNIFWILWPLYFDLEDYFGEEDRIFALMRRFVDVALNVELEHEKLE